MSTTHSRTSIVTGAAGGIGAALVKRLADRGDNVVLVDLDLDALAKVAADAGLTEERSLLLRADVTDEADVQAYVDRTLETFGRIERHRQHLVPGRDHGRPRHVPYVMSKHAVVGLTRTSTPG